MIVTTMFSLRLLRFQGCLRLKKSIRVVVELTNLFSNIS